MIGRALAKMLLLRFDSGSVARVDLDLQMLVHVSKCDGGGVDELFSKLASSTCVPTYGCLNSAWVLELLFYRCGWSGTAINLLLFFF